MGQFLIPCWEVRFITGSRISQNFLTTEWKEDGMDKFVDMTSDEFKELSREMKQALHDVQSVRDKYRPTLADKRYLTGEEVMGYLHISPRTLQNLRDTRTICYTSIGGKILYPEEELEQVLYQNYRSPELPF